MVIPFGPLVILWSICSLLTFVALALWFRKHARKAEAAQMALEEEFTKLRGALRALAHRFPPVEPVFGHQVKSGQSFLVGKGQIRFQRVLRLATDQFGVHFRPNAFVRLLSGLQPCSIPWSAIREVTDENPAAPKSGIEHLNDRTPKSLIPCQINGHMPMWLPAWCLEQRPDQASARARPELPVRS